MASSQSKYESVHTQRNKSSVSYPSKLRVIDWSCDLPCVIDTPPGNRMRRVFLRLGTVTR